VVSDSKKNRYDKQFGHNARAYSSKEINALNCMYHKAGFLLKYCGIHDSMIYATIMSRGEKALLS